MFNQPDTMFQSMLEADHFYDILKEAELLFSDIDDEEFSWESVKNHCFSFFAHYKFEPQIKKRTSIELIKKNEGFKEFFKNYVFF